MKILKKFTAITTAAVLLTAGNLSVLPTGAVNDFVVSASASEDGIIASGSCGAEGDNLTWTLDSEGTLTISGEGAMKDWEYLSDIPWNFYRENIVNVIIEDGVTSVGKGAFYDCYSLTSIIIPDSVTSIGVSAFEECTSLNSITIPDSVTSIEDYVFNSCEKLTSITIPDSVTSIGDYSFTYCKSLNSVEIPDSVTSIGDRAFDNTLWLDKKRKESLFVIVNGMLIDGETCIGDVVIPDSVTSIVGYAFYCCEELTSITIPDSVTSIGNYSFYGCEGLTSITIPDSIISIGDRAFAYTPWLDKKMKESPFVIVNGILIDGTTCEGDVVIPDSVTSIGSCAFLYCKSITSVTISDNVTSIRNSAFNGCESLTTITISDSVTSIGSSAFSGCTGLTTITIPDSVTSIDKAAFSFCGSLTSITIENPDCKICDTKYTIINTYDFESGEETFDGTIYGYKNSTAQAYAEKYGRKFAAIDEDIITTTTTTTSTTTTTTTTTSTATTTTTTTTTSKTTTTTTTTGKIVTGEFSDYGSDLTFTLDGDGNLTVEGEVSAEDWEALPICPWDGLQEDITAAVIEEKVAYIGEGAFTNCTNLTSITIKNPECEIHDSADTISDTATIYGYKGSAAQAYAEKYDREFVDLSIDLSCDITGDGVISASDATIVLNAYTIINSGKKSPLTDEQTKTADVDKDGKITGSDATLILRYATKLSSLLGGEKIPTFKEWFESVKTE